MKHLRSALAGILALFVASAALAQQFPTVPYHTVIGRLGVPGDTGPSQAIPFATLAAQIGALTSSRSINTTAPLAGGGDLTIDRTLSITGVAGRVLGGAAPAFTATPTLGIPGTITGTIAFGGITSGTATVTPQSTAGSPTLTLPNTSGTFAVGASSPLSLSATTGNLTCPTCATTTNGGSLSGTAPVAISAAGAISITGAAGQVLAGASPAFTATPVLGASGTLGTLGFGNATSGTVTLQPVAGALGSAVLSMPAITDTLAGKALANGGTNNTLTASNGGIVWSDASKLNILSGTATASQMLQSGSSATPAWSTATWPSTTTINQILYSSSANVVGGLATANGGILNASATGVPSITAAPVLGVAGTTVGTLGFQNATSGTITLSPVAGALGSVTLTLPAVTDTLAGKALANGGTNAALTASNGGIVWSNASQFQILAGTVTAGQCLLSGSTAAPTWGSCAGGASVTSIAGNTGAFTLSTGITNSVNDIRLDKATSANLEAGTSNKALTADNIFDAEVTITFAATQTLDFNTFLNARITATANTTSLTCSNIKASQSGVITWVQDATGSRTMVAGWCSQFRWAGGTRGVLSTAVNAIDALFYQCISTTICYVSLSKAEAN